MDILKAWFGEASSFGGAAARLGSAASNASRFFHLTKKGPGRSIGMQHKNNKPGSKIAKQAFNGMCTLRNGCGPAGRLAIEGKLGRK